MSKNLIVNLSVNCPEIDIFGPIKESTIDRLSDLLPNATTSTRSVRSPPSRFTFLPHPDHWHIKLDGQFCDVDGVSRLMVMLLDALEEEGDWTLVSTQASTLRNNTALQQDSIEHYKMFFIKYAGGH